MVCLYTNCLLIHIEYDYVFHFYFLGLSGSALLIIFRKISTILYTQSYSIEIEKSKMAITVNDLFNPFKDDVSQISSGASALLLATLIAAVMVLLVIANFYASLADVRGRVHAVLPFLENERAAWNWFGGAPGASTGFMSETSDTLLSNAGGKR